MARDAEKTLPVMLDSIRPFVKQIVVGVDELTKDGTKRIARKHGADEVFSLHVSDWHECPQHGRVLAQHFGNARQETFRHLDPNLDFWAWIDADDVLRGGERLKLALESLPQELIGIWSPYEYGAIIRADGQRKVNTLFHRERFLRTHFQDKPVQWTWEGRVHETVKPDVQTSWALNDDLVFVHQPGIHQTNDSAPRNLLLLEMDYEEDQTSPRTIFYLGNQHFAVGNMQQAVNWYELLCNQYPSANPYELWSSYLYMSIAYENLGDIDSANRAAYAALDLIPAHGEPYFRIASIANKCGEFEKALHWNNLGRKMKEAPFFAFKNPLDYTWNQRVVQGEALMNLGRVTEAQEEWHAAARVFIDEKLGGAIKEAESIMTNITTAESFVNIAENLDGLAALGLYQHLPLEVKAHGRTRDIVIPTLLEGRASTQPRIVFWCGKGFEPWAPPSLNTTGIGGSETAVIEIAKRFARDGWTVDVYNEAERYEGIYEGVGYWDLRRFEPSKDWPTVFVAWRHPGVYDMVKGEVWTDTARMVFWCHDLNYGPQNKAIFTHWTKILGVSGWHRDMLRRYYGVHGDGEIGMLADGGGFDFVPNGIDLARFSASRDIAKIHGRCVYASSPDRGLDTLLGLWPQILQAEPQAELHIAYGWETMDRMIAAGLNRSAASRDDLARFKAAMVKKIEETPRVVWRGRLPQDQLADLYSESVAWLYPTSFLEVSCISAMEAMAAGCIPVTTACGALPETIGDAGFLVPGPSFSRGFKDSWPKAAVGVLLERNVKMMFSEQARRRATGLTWDESYKRWLSVLGLDGERQNGHGERAEIAWGHPFLSRKRVTA